MTDGKTCRYLLIKASFMPNIKSMTTMWMFPKIGKHPKWMFNKGRPYVLMDDLGGKKPTIFGTTHVFVGGPSWLDEVSTPLSLSTSDTLPGALRMVRIAGHGRC